VVRAVKLSRHLQERAVSLAANAGDDVADARGDLGVRLARAIQQAALVLGRQGGQRTAVLQGSRAQGINLSIRVTRMPSQPRALRVLMVR
jgi:hypothetical protein